MFASLCLMLLFCMKFKVCVHKFIVKSAHFGNYFSNYNEPGILNINRFGLKLLPS
jgi:hypothetical protein